MSASASVTVRFRRLRPGATLPQYMTAGAAGMDVTSAADGPMEIAPGARVGVPTGWAMEIPVGFEAQVRPRSGLAIKHGVTVVNAPGTIDADYRGELIILLVNLGRATFTIAPGDRIAQLVIAPVVQAGILEVDALSPSARGAGGFGHTGGVGEEADGAPPPAAAPPAARPAASPPRPPAAALRPPTSTATMIPAVPVPRPPSPGGKTE